MRVLTSTSVWPAPSRGHTPVLSPPHTVPGAPPSEPQTSSPPSRPLPATQPVGYHKLSDSLSVSLPHFVLCLQSLHVCLSSLDYSLDFWLQTPDCCLLDPLALLRSPLFSPQFVCRSCNLPHLCQLGCVPGRGGPWLLAGNERHWGWLTSPPSF